MADENVLVGYDTTDDAGVYLLDEGKCLVQTTDFFPPVVDDPKTFGRIAAANSISDIYAMGARPLFALAVVCFPIGKLGSEVLAEIMLGGQEKAGEAGISIIGGHSVDDAEPKFGLVVTGIVDKDKLVRNDGAHPGDLLMLTKPIGSGIYTTALKQGKASQQEEGLVVDVMSGLNKAASEAMIEVGVNACTDITGYGLLGHLVEMLEASAAAAIVVDGEVPRLPGLRKMTLEGAVPGGTMMNLRFVEEHADWHPSLDEISRVILCDAQTSGGLLVSCSPDKREAYQSACKKRGVEAPIIGVVFDGPAGAIGVVP